MLHCRLFFVSLPCIVVSWFSSNSWCVSQIYLLSINFWLSKSGKKKLLPLFFTHDLYDGFTKTIMAIKQDITFPFINSVKNYVNLVTKNEKKNVEDNSKNFHVNDMKLRNTNYSFLIFVRHKTTNILRLNFTYCFVNYVEKHHHCCFTVFNYLQDIWEQSWVIYLVWRNNFLWK